ncbi:uncharacterized protein LOC111076053 [Drosophila obscura]|uniref:uncharacterized protein LOC111076053 n=1 Tax=Drosophila obscura TaxID=7282 RepID=UPI001BB22009|nr:uncharacterized protein LOC111076053 [Drosophila obscura]
MVDCLLCGSSVENVRDYGPSFHYDKQNKVHRNCLYLSSNLVQRGDDNNGISRFLKEDILAEVKRASKLSCIYCAKNGASIGCCRAGCRRSFHYSCGLENLARNQFCGSYKSYCHTHVGRTKVRPSADEKCVMCLELVMPEQEKFSQVLMLQAPCCRNGWFHKKCVQMYAYNAGYFFKCPLCNSSTKFMDVCLWGVSVPNSDATWETEPNAFRDQLVRDVTCTVSDCIAIDGPNSDSRSITFCQLCGSNPVHCYCIAGTDMYICETCSIVEPPMDDSDDEFEMFARPSTSTRRDSQARNLNRSRYHDKLRAPSTDDEYDDEEDDWESIADQVKARRCTVGAESANTPSPSLAVPAAAQPTEASGRSTVETDGRMTTGSSGVSAAAESAPISRGPRMLRSSTRTRLGFASRARSIRNEDLPRLSPSPHATVAPPAAARQRTLSRRRTLAAEHEGGVQHIGQRRLTLNAARKEATPLSEELRRRRHSATRPRHIAAPESRAENTSCIANRTRKRTTTGAPKK